MPNQTKKQLLDRLAGVPQTDGDALKSALLDIFEQIIPNDQPAATDAAPEE